MTRQEYHAARRERFRLLEQIGSSNSIGYSQEEASRLRYYADEIAARISPPFDHEASARKWRLARLQNELRYFVRFGRRMKQPNASIWP